MARTDDALTCLRKAQAKLKEVQRNLAEAQTAALPEAGGALRYERGALTELVEMCVRLKVEVIRQYEYLGGEWPERCREQRRVSDRTVERVDKRRGHDGPHRADGGYTW